MILGFRCTTQRFDVCTFCKMIITMFSYHYHPNSVNFFLFLFFFLWWRFFRFTLSTSFKYAISCYWVWVKVAQSCPTLCDPVDYTVHGTLQARILEWGAFPFSRGSSQPRDRSQFSRIAGGFFTSWAIKYSYYAVQASQVALVVKSLLEMQETRDVGAIPGWGRLSGGGHDNPLQYSCLENPMDRGAWCILRVAKSLDMTEVT